MDFCSKYGYDYGFEGSDSEEISDDEVKREEEAKGSSGSSKKAMKRVRKADSNLIAVKFDQLVSTNKMFAGDAVHCKSCGAILTEASKKSINADEKTWTCEYCYEKNDVSRVVLDQIPTQDDVTFLIEPAPVVDKKDESSDENVVKSLDENYLTYCIDISGSMDTAIAIKQDESANQLQQRQHIHMSRLNGVAAACLESIDVLKGQEPNKRVALVTFSDNIKYYGDTSKGPNPLLVIGSAGGYYRQHAVQQSNSIFGQIRSRVGNAFSNISSPIPPADPVGHAPNLENAPDIMDNKEKMIALASNQDHNLKPISETHVSLRNRVKALRTEGSTALGPALTFSIGQASHKAGSQVILCTDGCANVGMGSIETGNPDIAEKFYEDLADYAKSRGVSVNVISMEGTDCKLALLGKVADRSNGTMNIVNPLKLGEQFKSILENRVVATNVKAKLIVNKYLYIRDEQLEAAELKAAEENDDKTKDELNKQKKSIVEKDIGNACIDTEITFEYGVRKLAEAEKKQAPELKNVPFQLQITYVDQTGAKALRVYTKVQEFTKDRHQVERNLLDQNLIWSNAVQKISNYALDSNMKAAKYKEKLQTKMAYERNWAMPQMYQMQQQQVQASSSSTRAREMNDMDANMFHAAKKMNRKNLK